MTIDLFRLIWNINIVGGEQNRDTHVLKSVFLSD